MTGCGYYFYRWEMVPVAQSTLPTTPVQFALSQWNTYGHIQADPSEFNQHFRWNQSNSNFTSFTNLSGDATLVAPYPSGNRNYSNLSNFLRNAPLHQKLELWKEVAAVMKRNLKRNKGGALWMSTTVGGIPWLHVRIDSQPKYYHFDGFKVYKKSKFLNPQII